MKRPIPPEIAGPRRRKAGGSNGEAKRRPPTARRKMPRRRRKSRRRPRKKPKPKRRGITDHGDNTGTQGSRQRAQTTEEVLPPEKILPVLHGLEPENRLQGNADPPGFHNGARQDHAPKDHGKLRKAPAGTDRGHQAGANDCPAALCRIRRITEADGGFETWKEKSVPYWIAA